MRLKLVDELGVAQAQAAHATQRLDGAERAKLASFDREEAANSKLRMLYDMGLPIDDLLFSPCQCPGLAAGPLTL